jgi:membrane-bound lytic murein transglycosylase D
MPEKLVWLAFVESGVNPMAYSRARAVGIWQFILSTGKRYGLRRTPYVDERKDFILSTRSAIQYLKTLYLSYGSWELALAAYNAGEKKVDKAIRKTRHADYWGHIQRRRILPRETKNYVPKLIAAYKVGQHLEEYGFSFDPAVEPVTFVVVPVTRPISLSDLAQSLSIPRTVLDELNPHLRKGVTPPGEVFPLRVPPSLKEVALNTIPNLPPVNLSQFAEYEQEMVHRVRKGETLWSIARKYGVSYRTLMEENDLRKTILRPGQKLYIPIRSSRSSRIYTQTTASSYRLYRVRRGDTLYRISRRWGVPIKDILSLNGEKRKEVLKEGEVIKIPISPSF